MAAILLRHLSRSVKKSIITGVASVFVAVKKRLPNRDCPVYESTYVVPTIISKYALSLRCPQAEPAGDIVSECGGVVAPDIDFVFF